MQIKITNSIIQYPNLFEPRSFQDGKATYNAKILLDKTTQADLINEIKLAIKTMCLDNKIAFKPDSFKCLKDGADSGIEKLSNYFVLTAKANEKFAPKVIGRDLKPYVGDVGSGSVCNLIVTFWAFNHMNISKGVACNLKAVQVTGEVNQEFAYDGEVRVEDCFEALESSKSEDFDALDQDIPF